MRLAVYKTKFFDFLAGNLRRLAEFLSVESLTEKDDSTSEKTFSPLEDWLEKTQNVAPEQWLDFSGENDFEPAPESSFDDENKEGFVLRRPEKQLPTELLVEKKRELSKQSETSNNPEIALTKKPKKKPADSRFLSFSIADKKTSEARMETLESVSEISRQPRAENEKSIEAVKLKFRLLPAEPISKAKPKTSESSAPNIINSVENQPPPKFEIPAFERKESVVKIEEISPPEKTFDEMPPIIKKPAARAEFFNQFSLEAFSRKNEPPPETSFELPKRKATDETIFKSKSKRAPETPKLSSSRKNSKTVVNEYFKSERGKKNGGENDDAGKFTVVESPWIDLPDEATGETENSFSENERLHFLEREQAGKT